ncbi:hypothetical protein Tco_0976589 [Tanacetum coccineum]|uniref:Uncharacterized protein n=1 Tax=Tanacetum coccineum TaxID=301880 RepID=A0ABQ5EHZ2_9ASTR
MEEDQVGSDPGKSHVALAGPNPEPMHDGFVATVYPQVHEGLKHTTEEYVHMENPLSSSGTLSSMKNRDPFTFGDQLINDKSAKEEPRKANVKDEVESMVTVPIHQASSSVPPLSTPVIDLSPPKQSTHPVHEQLITATTETTTTTLPPPPPTPTQSSTDADLAALYKVVKEVVQTALQAPLQDRFRDLSKVDMKEILHQRMFESGSYRSHPEHASLYEALERSINYDNREAFFEEKAKSPWKTSDTRDAPSSSSKEKTAYQPAQPVDEDPIPDNVHMSEPEDTDIAHLPKIKTRPDWLKPVPKEETPETLEPDWVIPPNDLPETENNWADVLGKTYKDPEENKLLQKTGDMGVFIRWYCKQIGKKKLTKANLEGPAYMTVRPFHQNNIQLQF